MRSFIFSLMIAAIGVVACQQEQQAEEQLPPQQTPPPLQMIAPSLATTQQAPAATTAIAAPSPPPATPLFPINEETEKQPPPPKNKGSNWSSVISGKTSIDPNKIDQSKLPDSIKDKLPNDNSGKPKPPLVRPIIKKPGTPSTNTGKKP